MPNIIILMSESFSLTDDFKNIDISEYPTPFIRGMMGRTTHGDFISMTLNGGTANVEYEALTASLTKFMPYGMTPYTGFMELFSKDIPTIPKTLRENGYKTVAIHTYTSGFYNRNIVYPLLGFDRRVFSEDIDPERIKADKSEYNCAFISDMLLSELILEELDASEEKPAFIFAISVENHRPYNEGKYHSAFTPTVTSDTLSDSDLIALNNYVHGLSNADRAFEYLITELEKSSRPTVVLFFGDHKPSLGDRNDTYIRLGMIDSIATTDWSDEQLLGMLKIPALIWSNYEDRNDDIGYIGANYLFNYLIDYINETAEANGLGRIKKPLYFELISSLQKDFVMYRDRLFIDGSGKYYWLFPVLGYFVSWFDSNFSYEETNLFVRFDKDNVKDWKVLQTGGTFN